MSRYSVDTDALRSAAGRCNDISNSIGYLARQTSNVKYSLNNDMGRYSSVISALETCVTNSYRCHDKVNYFGNYGIDIANKYKSTEDTVRSNISASRNMRGTAGWADATGTPGGNAGKTAHDAIWYMKKTGKVILDVIGKAGTIGKIGALPIALLKTLIDGDGFTYKDTGAFIKGFGNTILGVGDLYSKTKFKLKSADFKQLFGLNAYKTLEGVSAKAGWLAKLKQAGSTFGDTLKNELSPYTVGTDGVKKLSGTKVAGWALSFIANGFSNADEYKKNLGTANEISKGRAVAETISETLIDIGKGAAITAGIAAGCAAIGVAAPAVVVGGAAVAVSAVADIVCENLTGKAVTELASDFILDTAPKLAEKAVGVAKSVGKSVSGWFNKVVNNGPKLAWSW